MNPLHREGQAWPSAHGANTQRPQQQQQHQREESTQPPRTHNQTNALPPPHQSTGTSPFDSRFHQQTQTQAQAQAQQTAAASSSASQPAQPRRNFGAMPGMNQASPRHQTSGVPLQPPPFNMSGASQQQSAQDSKEREARDVHIKEEQLRERELQRQHMDQLPSHQTQSQNVHLHQPVAVGPRTVHGPNGLLGNPSVMNPSNPPHSHLPPHAGSGAVFGPGAVQPPQPAHPAHTVQTLQSGMLLPFAPAVQPQSANSAQGQQPILNDALSYLDQVKVQFVDHPDVYNRFLDIMKDFKSGAIDTPGVIERVSTLFAGNPELIQGFNTFLPPGYRIECGTGDDPNSIRVTTPMGTTVSTMPGVQPSLSNPAPPAPSSLSEGPAPATGESSFARFRPGEGSFTPQHQAPPQPVQSPTPRHLGVGNFAAQLAQQQQQQQQHQHQLNALEAHQREQQALAHQQEQRNVSQLQNAVSAAASDALPRQPLMSPSGASAASMAGQEMAVGPDGQPMAPGMEKRGPVEFNHAISYVNKIKNRFSAQPDIYKQFLEILQTYQRESKPIQDVYGQVTRLFNSAPDLLEDFKQFLPESAAHAKAAAAARQQQEDAVMMSNVRGEPYYPSNAQPQHTPRAEHRLPPVGNFAPTPTVNKDNKRKRTDRQGTVVSNNVPEPNNASAKPPTAYGHVANANKRVKQTHNGKHALVTDAAPLSPTLVPVLPSPLPPTQTSLATGEELGFFDRAKKVIGNKNTMNEFLKLCNLFSQDLIDRTTLLHKACSFIGTNPDLFAWFKEWVGAGESDTIVENKPRVPTGRVILSNCRGLGPSYRLLPKRERLKPCRGRDELCNEVLNDDWASHPTWASEDSGFIAHRKNIHEEGLHKIEEERHDYDFNIEACGRTIQLLEPIAQQLHRMPAREQEAMEIPPGLGGQSETIHKRIVMKLYGREKGMQVVDQLHAKPYAVIPILLNRLKQKQEEWKQAQREWEKVWREQTQKMFWKSLDHQAVSAKQADKRQFQTKVLVGEIQTKYEEQKRARLAQQGNIILGPQMSYEFEDTDVILDASHLLLMFAEKTHSTDYPRLTSFIREFIPMFFGLDPEWFNQQIKSRFGDWPHVETPEEGISAFDDPVAARPRKPNGKKDGLLRGVLERGRKGRKDDGSQTPVSRASTPDNASHADEDAADGMHTMEDVRSEAAIDVWIQHPLHGNIFKDRDVLLMQPYKRDVFNLYGNTSIYCFIRIFVFLYERLGNLKRAEADVHETVKRATAKKPATELGIIDKMPQDFFSNTTPEANYYSQMLGLFEDLIRDEVEVSVIEDVLRRYYLQSGWQLYSLDKLLGALVRFAISMTSSDSKDRSWDILQLFKKDRAKEETTCQDELNYRKQVEKHTKDGDIFKIAYDQKLNNLSIQIFKKDDPAQDTFRLLEEDRWRVYVNNYTRLPVTEPQLPVKRPYIPSGKIAEQLAYSNAANPEERSTSWRAHHNLAAVEDNLSIRISVEQYKLIFERNTEDYFYFPFPNREHGNDGRVASEQTVMSRAEQTQDNHVINNDAMKGLSKKDVEGNIESFNHLIQDGQAMEGEGSDGDDDEMEE